MLRRSLLELSSRRSFGRITRPITPEPVPPFHYWRKKFSSATKGNGFPQPDPTGKEKPKGGSSNVLLGTAIFAGTFLAVYQAGYLDQYLNKEEKKSSDSNNFDADIKKRKDAIYVAEETAAPNAEESVRLGHSAERKFETQPDILHAESLNEKSSESHLQEKTDVSFVEGAPKSDVTPPEGKSNAEEERLPECSNSTLAPNNNIGDSKPSLVSITEVRSLGSKDNAEQSKNAATNAEASSVHQGKETESAPLQNSSINKTKEDYVSQDAERPASLLEEYHLKENAADGSIPSQSVDQFAKDSKILVNTIEELNDGYLTKDGKLVLDFLAAIHAAEKRQADMDARVFAEEKRALKERYENELRDLRARELMRIEEAALLDKELKRERVKAAAAIKSIQEKMEERLKTELEQKENEEKMKLKKFQELAKAELAATVASEKAAQIEKTAEANLHINALCMAFYARSEEARKSHSVHKLALGALALEDALSKGLPIQRQIDALQPYLEGIEKDSILDLVLSSLPEETRHHGTDTLLQLSQEFNTLKQTLRHFSFIPPSGGGVLTHSVAHLASWLKVKEVDASGDGIESIIKRVDDFLAEGKLAAAAEALEEGVKGSQAEVIVSNWVRQARNRAITEQALTLLESYATCASLT